MLTNSEKSALAFVDQLWLDDNFKKVVLYPEQGNTIIEEGAVNRLEVHEREGKVTTFEKISERIYNFIHEYYENGFL